MHHSSYRKKKIQSKSKSKKQKLRRTLRKKRGLARGPNSDPISPTSLISCAMCEKKFPRNNMLVPSACPSNRIPGTKKMYADRSHRICQNCWWPKPGNPESGFARVDGDHGCPGCKRGLPPNPSLKQPEVIEVIDLISSSD